ncbi:unnamed protein product [Adineta steineri]|uniref:Uncharacterized protein n=1 Tax=Adineta steineri TaxID=433720 RepID=A0A819XY41_9BILA|nr:unnamed protein product [Adineta steineri]CAF1033142.1 unnamed protein product [Adineta steineri]CAF3937651.1 unnamed protein product [Adineta steineri]CAF4149551.1 unnamed protein product [Adineta steineri]CAF4226942.1 unnamed protein product [Adineta steineri]
MRYILLILVITVLIVADFAEEMDEQATEGMLHSVEYNGLLDSAINNQLESTYVKPMDGTDERSSFIQCRVKRARGCGCGRGGSGGGKQHTKNARPSPQQKHEKGQTRKGGEKGDPRRPYRK